MQAADRRLAFPLAIALAFLAAHLPFLAPTLEDVDSINFALGVRDFDPARHQPHPPGAPVFIALGKLSTAAFDLVVPAGAAGVAGAPTEKAEIGGDVRRPRRSGERGAGPGGLERGVRCARGVSSAPAL